MADKSDAVLVSGICRIANDLSVFLLTDLVDIVTWFVPDKTTKVTMYDENGKIIHEDDKDKSAAFDQRETYVVDQRDTYVAYLVLGQMEGVCTYRIVRHDSYDFVRERTMFVAGKIHGESEFYNEEGTVYKRFTYANGAKMIATHMWPNGKLSQLTYYKNEKKQGVEKYWDEQGRLRGVERWHEGLEHGKCESIDHDHGTVIHTDNRHGERHGVERVWIDNVLRRQTQYYNDALHGLDEQWYANGKKEQQCRYIMGKKHGLSTEWYENGQMSYKCTFVYDRQHGVENAWYADGTPQKSLGWAHGRRDGVDQRWNTKGRLIKKRSWKHGMKHGKEKLWRPNGAKWIERNWRFGVMHGVEQKWDITGTNVFKRRVWDYGN